MVYPVYIITMKAFINNQMQVSFSLASCFSQSIRDFITLRHGEVITISDGRYMANRFTFREPVFSEVPAVVNVSDLSYHIGVPVKEEVKVEEPVSVPVSEVKPKVKRNRAKKKGGN